MDLSDSSLTIYYDDGSTEVIDILPSMVSGFSTASAGNYTYTVTYQGFTDTVAYTVSDIGKTLLSIEVRYLEKYYNVGDELDLTDALLELYYDDGSFEYIPLTLSMISGFDTSSIGTKQLTASYLGLTTNYTYYVFAEGEAGVVNVYYIDLGATGGSDGEAALIKAGDIEVLIDSGDNNTSSKAELLDFLNSHVFGRLDYIIATHPDADHIGGMSMVLENFVVDNVILYSSTNSPSGVQSTFETAVSAEGATVYRIYQDIIQSGDTVIDLNDYAFMQFYDTTYLTRTDKNASSIVFVLEAYETRFLFNGDAESSQENVYAPLVGDVDVLKMGHHGSAEGTSANLLATVKPEVVVVNNGNFLGNSYNHPTYAAVSRVYDYSILVPVYAVTGGNKTSTSRMNQRNGDLTFTVDSKGYRITSQYYGNNPIELSATDYWHNADNPHSSKGYYYAAATGIDLGLLKQALHNIIDDHIEYSYDFAKEALKNTDEDPNNPNNVILFYTGRSQGKDTFGTGSNQWNREHVWAKSHGGFGESAPAGSDLHHLRPTDVNVNSKRGSLDFANGGVKVVDDYGEGSSFCYCVDGVSFEPRDEVKGDVARILFYMAVRYEGDVAGEPNLELNDLLGNGSSPYMGKLSVLLEWHRLDPVDDFERHRNDVIFSYQGNRNPFIDNPDYAEMIFGNK